MMLRKTFNPKFKLKTVGFTLFDTIIVLAILGLLLAFTWPSLSKVRRRYELEMAVWEIHARMNQLRYQAIRESIPYRLKIYPNRYSIEKYDRISNEMSWVPVTTALISGASLEANNSPAFYPEGTVSNLTTILIQNSAGKYRLTLAISGRIKVTRLKEGSG